MGLVSGSGARGDSGERRLESSANDFERGKRDDFYVTCPDLGELQAKLVEGGNDAAAEYPKLDRILSAEVVE